MEIPFADLRRDHDELAPDLQAAYELVLEGGDFVLGGELKRFEREFAAYVGVEHCVGVGSGTAALELALRALGIGEGDEIIVPAHTFIASALAVLHAGARPAFCDVDDSTGLIDLDSAAAVMSAKTAAIMPVHLYGQLCEMDAVAKFARKHGLAVVEDAAQAHGAGLPGARAGSYGDAAAFSFYPSKNLGALGDAGAICTGDPAVAERVRRLRNLGQRAKGEHVVAGVNERLDTMQAAFLRVKLRHLDRWNELRRAAAKRYGEKLPDGVRTLPPDRDAGDVFHLYPVRVDGRDELSAALRDAGIASGIHYFPAVHEQPPFAGSGEHAVAERWAREELSLPIYPAITANQVDRVCAAVEIWLGR